jgi:endoglucanase
LTKERYCCACSSIFNFARIATDVFLHINIGLEINGHAALLFKLQNPASHIQLMKYISRLAVSALVAIITIFALPHLTHAAGTANVSVWWPTEGARISATQPLKALVDGTPVENYSMYWQVDGGQLNAMANNYTDYPHKETSIDISGWNWNSTGSYVLNFLAKDGSGATIGEKKVTIINEGQKPAVTTTTTGTTNTGTVSITPTAPITTTTTSPTVTTQPTTTVTTTTSAKKAEVWWPTDGSTVTGVQPFKAVVSGLRITSYKMYWQVDGGQPNIMNDSYSGTPHKEVLVDLSGWNWKGSGPYTLTFIAKSSNGSEIARKSVSIKTGNATVTPPPAPTATPTTTVSNPVITTPPPAPASGNPLQGVSFYTNPNSNAKRQADLWKTSRPTDALQMEKIYSQPEAKWLGDWNSNIYTDTKTYVDQAAALGKVPVMIAYNIPQRDCGSYSAGGANNPDGYRAWIKGLADGIGTRNAVVILEPDALTLTDCLSSTDKATRFLLIKEAISTLRAKGGTIVYVDAGHSNWIAANEMATRLKSAGIELANGFALNVSNYNWTADQIKYGETISSQIGGKHFVVDTSRNGTGPNGGEWCNPQGRALGAKVTTSTGSAYTDAFLWLKNPGESDGTCNGGPSAGVWWPEYALGLAQRAGY